MPNWLNSKKKFPTKWQSYFVKIDGRKDICRLDWLIKWSERYPEKHFEWLDDDKEYPEEKKKKAIASAVKKTEVFSKRPWD